MSLVCRICMELVVGSNSMSLFNKTKYKKTSICQSYEQITGLLVQQDDQLPKECCFPCVAELNRCIAFREKCRRTLQTLATFYKNDGSDDDEEKEIEIILPEEKSNDAIVHRNESLSTDVDNASSNHLIELTEEEEGCKANENEIGEEGVVLVYCINENTVADETIVVEASQEEATTTTTNNSGLKCTICSMEFVRKKNFENHFQKYHKEKDTNELSSSSSQIRLHLKREKSQEDELTRLKDDPNAKHCKYCNALFLNEKSLKIHERRKNCQLETYECSVKNCKKVFTDKNLHEQHMKLNHSNNSEIGSSSEPIKKYRCSYENCTKSFNMLSTFRDHQRTHDQTKPFICSICNRGFSQNTNLKQHLRRHNAIKPFKCQWDVNMCTKSFVSKGELDSHLRKHSGAHPFACESCDSKFTTSSSLVKHRRIHSGEKPYSCNYCPMRFTALGTLKNHQKTHTGERPHACRYCEKSFAQKSDMTSHERTHTQNRPYSCKICNMSFHQNGTLKTHMKIHSKLQDGS